MRQSPYSAAEHVATFTEQQAAGNTTAVVQASLPKLEPNFASLGVWEASRLKALEVENARLKKLLAEAVLMLDNVNLQNLVGDNADLESVIPLRRQKSAAGPRLRLLSSDGT